MPETIALFGGTGRTGRHVITYALDKGYKVQMLARTPSKVETTHDNLTVIEGDLANTDAIQQVVKGATYVMSCAGGPSNMKEYPPDLMLNFVKLLYPIMEAESSVKVFFFQAGRFSDAPNQSTPLLITFLRYTIGYLLGFESIVADNQKVTFFMAENKKRFDFILTRPGFLTETDKEMDVVAEYASLAMPISFKALAKFNVDSLTDTSLYGTYPYLASKSK